MNYKKLNNAVIDYQNGNEQALDAVFRYILPLIENHSESIRHKVSNNVKFECRCLLQIRKAARKFDPEKGGSFKRLLFRTIQKEKSDFVKRRKPLRDVISEEAFKKEKENDHKKRDFLFMQDESVSIDGDVLAQEKITYLAEGDRVKELILKCWTNSHGTDSDIADLLADKYGGKKESHRKVIQRLRKECKRRLSHSKSFTS